MVPSHCSPSLGLGDWHEQARLWVREMDGISCDQEICMYSTREKQPQGWPGGGQEGREEKGCRGWGLTLVLRLDSELSPCGEL